MDRSHIRTSCKLLSKKWAEEEKKRHQSNLRNIKQRPVCTSFEMSGIKATSVIKSLQSSNNVSRKQMRLLSNDKVQASAFKQKGNRAPIGDFYGAKSKWNLNLQMPI